MCEACVIVCSKELFGCYLFVICLFFAFACCLALRPRVWPQPGHGGWGRGHEPENGMMNFSSSEANAASDAIEQASRDHFQCGLKLRLRDRQSLAAGPSGLAAKTSAASPRWPRSFAPHLCWAAWPPNAGRVLPHLKPRCAGGLNDAFLKMLKCSGVFNQRLGTFV